MVVARKSDVYAKGTWFQRHFTLPLGKRKARQGSAARSASTTAAQAAPVASKQRRLSKNLSVSSTNKVVTPTSMKELGRQQTSNLNGSSATPKRLKEDFIGVPVMPSSKSAPLWLLRLYTLHRYSSVVAFLFVAATLVVYGWTVYSQELWSQEYRRVQNLQRHERLLTTTNATLTNKMAEEAERPTAGLVSPTPEGTIFLSPVPQSPNPASSPKTPNSETQQQTLSPLGY
ncbi:MAG: hypothetical protein KME40_31530 [Komarekiella atlantica HA4396-MV6]|jgi:hypothetical protein|nr:hypothetical protein [Komarekiella atlantica HA4396-MV6]